MPDFSTNLAIESWTLWAVGIVLVGARIVSRRMTLGAFKKLQLDDWLMLFTVLTFTGCIVSVNEVANNGSNYLPDGVAETLTPDEVENAIYGSKMTLVLEEFTLFTTWQIKACLLLLYNRLTLGLKQNVAVKILGAYCVLGFIVTQILYLGVWCRPIQQYWAVPVHDSQCATYYSHMITATVFNVSSDLMMLLIPIPLMINAQLPLKRKVILCGIFSLGIFVILAACLNRYYNFTVQYSIIFLNWYAGEVATAVIVANIPLCWPVVRWMFRLDSFGGSSQSKTPGTYGTNLSSGKNIYSRKGNLRSGADRLSSRDNTEVGGNESEERITGHDRGGWTPEQAVLELSPMDSKIGYRARVNAAKDESRDVEFGKDGIDDHAITKTVHVTQHFS